MREIITAASAAGVAVAFGSPIGGVLFSIEVPVPPISCICNFKRVSTGDEPNVSHQNYVEKLRVRAGCDIYAVRQWIHLSCPATLTLLF